MPNQRAIKKKENFDLIYAIDKEKYANFQLSYILLGDVGEYDEDAYKLIADQYPQSIKAIFLHVVGHPDDQGEYIDYNYLDIPIIYFHTYSGAAMKAYKLGLISIDGVSKVLNSSLQYILPSTTVSSKLL